jgi:hypothetical protein
MFTISITLKLDQVRTLFFHRSKDAFILITATIRCQSVHYIPKRNKNPALTKFIMVAILSKSKHNCTWLTAKLPMPFSLDLLSSSRGPWTDRPTSLLTSLDTTPKQSSSSVSLSTPASHLDDRPAIFPSPDRLLNGKKMTGYKNKTSMAIPNNRSPQHLLLWSWWKAPSVFAFIHPTTGGSQCTAHGSELGEAADCVDCQSTRYRTHFTILCVSSMRANINLSVQKKDINFIDLMSLTKGSSVV